MQIKQTKNQSKNPKSQSKNPKTLVKDHNFWRQISRDKNSKLVFLNLKTEAVAVEEDHFNLVEIPEDEARRYRLEWEKEEARRVKEENLIMEEKELLPNNQGEIRE